MGQDLACCGGVRTSGEGDIRRDSSSSSSNSENDDDKEEIPQIKDTNVESDVTKAVKENKEDTKEEKKQITCSLCHESITNSKTMYRIRNRFFHLDCVA